MAVKKIKSKQKPTSSDDKKGLKKKPPSPQQRMEALNLSLPDELNEPVTKIEGLHIMIHGAKGIGKTSLAARFNKSFTCQFEPGGKLLRTYQRPCPEWIYFKSYVQMLEKEPEKYKTLVIDTGSLAYERCMRYVCEVENMSHPSDEKWGKGWDFVKKEFSDQLIRVMSLGMGTVTIVHSIEKDIETKSGNTYTRIVPQLTGQAESYFAGPIDICGYYHYVGTERWLQIRGDDFVEAKCRAEENFIALDGNPVYMIPMGTSPDESYENFVSAFNNEQSLSYAPEEYDKKSTKKLLKKSKKLLKKKGKRK